MLALLKWQDSMRAMGAHKVVQREYRCEKCHGWHLTSLERFVEHRVEYGGDGEFGRVLDGVPDAHVDGGAGDRHGDTS